MTGVAGFGGSPARLRGVPFLTVVLAGAVVAGTLLAVLPDAMLPYYLGGILFMATAVACIVRPVVLLYFVILSSSLSDLFSITGSLGGVSLSGVRWVFVAALTGIVLVSRGHPLTVPRVLVPMGLFVAWAGVRFMLSPSGVLGLKDLVLYAIPFFVGTFAFVIRRHPGLLRERDVKRVVLVSMLLPVALLLALFALGAVEYTRLGPRGIVSGRPTAAFLAVMSAVPLAMARYAYLRRERIRGAAVAAISLVSVLLTLSRAASAVAIGLTLVSRARPGRVVRLTVATGLAVVMVGALFWQVPLFRDRNFFRSSQVTTFDQGLELFNTSGRETMWPVVFRHAMERPFIGWGLGDSRVTLVRLGVGNQLVEERHPHNEYLQVLNDLGFVGLGLLCYGWGILLLRLYQSWKRHDAVQNLEGAWISQAGLLSSTAVLLLAITGNAFHYAFLTAPCFVLVGMWAAQEGDGAPRATAGAEAW